MTDHKEDEAIEKREAELEQLLKEQSLATTDIPPSASDPAIEHEAYADLIALLTAGEDGDDDTEVELLQIDMFGEPLPTGANDQPTEI